MRATVIVIFASLTAIGIILVRTFFEESEELENDLSDYDPQETFITAVQNVNDDIRRIYRKVETDETMVNVTLGNFWHLARYVNKQTEDMAVTVGETIRDLDEEVKRQTEQLNKVYEKYLTDLDLIPVNKVKYKNLNDHIIILLNNTKKELLKTKNEIRNEIEKSQLIKRDLLAIDVEMERMKEGLSVKFVEDVISEIGEKIKKLKEGTENRITEIIQQMKDRVYNVSDKVEDNFGFRELRELFSEVEKSMLDISLEVQKIVDLKRDESLASISACKKKYFSIKQRIIEFVGGVETSISAENSWVRDVTRQIDEMSRLRVKLLTEKGEETQLDYGEDVPFFGILPNEILASYDKEENKITITNYGVKSDGSQFIREITKEQVEEEIHIKEVFYDEEGQVRSEKSYIFYYVG